MKAFHGASCRVTETQSHIENTAEYVQSLRVAARWQRELLYVMAFQEMGWALIDEGDVEDFDLLNITGDESESEFGTPFFDIDKVIPIWSDETEDCLYCHIS